MKHQYGAGVLKRGKTFQVGDTGTWKTVKWTLKDALFRNRCQNNDFRITVVGDVDFIIGQCHVSGSPKQSVVMPDLFSSGMILQRDKPISVWGQAKDGVTVTVSFNDVERECGAENGKWKVTYPAMRANAKPSKMTITSSDGFERKLNEILIGDVWLASGQSNMSMRVVESKGAKEAIAASKNREIRFFKVPLLLENTVLPLGRTWLTAGPRVTGGFSAVAYYFAREIQDTQKIPVGIVQCAYGGTFTETWSSPSVMKQGYPGWEKYQAAQLKDPKFPMRKTSSYLYKRMLKTVMPFPVKGFLWYQGEGNSQRAQEQKKLFPAMVNDWRSSWGDPSLPFYLVQLTRYEDQHRHQFRLAQLEVWQKIPHSFMAVTIDLSKDWNPKNHPVHPTTKAPIGHRLALAARANVYGENDLVYSGPVIQSAKSDGSKAILSFKHIGSGLAAIDGQALRGFHVSSNSKKFVEATAVIRDNHVVVTATNVANPAVVRYGAEVDMGKENLDVNLGNKEKLPASPFTIKVK